MAKVVVDAGHGGSDPGAVYEGRQEKDDNLALALAVGSILAENGVDVVYTRTDDSYETPFRRPRRAIRPGRIFLSLSIEIPARKMTSTPVWRPWSTMSRG